MELKPLDLVVALCIGARDRINATQKRKLNTLRDLHSFTGVSLGAISASQNRLLELGLVSKVPDLSSSEMTDIYQMNKIAALEFLSHGLKYYSHAERHGFGVGTATSWSCKDLDSEMIKPDIPLVWENPDGSERGEFITPIHPSVVKVSANDKKLYKLFAILDAIRTGKPRELKIARDLLVKELG